MNRTICIPLVDRANYGRLLPLMRLLRDDQRFTLQVIVGGSMVLDRFGHTWEPVANEFEIAGRVWCELEGNTPWTMAKSVALSAFTFADEFRRLEPDFVLLIGDRYEALGAGIAAAYSNHCLVHLQGGELSGSIDESARHALTALAHYHVPATVKAADRLYRMGQRAILTVGCPSSDLARDVLIQSHGKLLVQFHPTTTECDSAGEQMCAILHALNALAMPTLLFWPNIDSGADAISKAIRIFGQHPWLETVKNLEPEEYLSVLAGSPCCIGNSSGFVRDSSYFGTPVVLVGNRQRGREHGRNVMQTTFDGIVEAVRHQLNHGPYEPSALYGDGHASERIVEKLATVPVYSQKRWHGE